VWPSLLYGIYIAMVDRSVHSSKTKVFDTQSSSVSATKTFGALKDYELGALAIRRIYK
jgi:hypothetical protein